MVYNLKFNEIWLLFDNEISLNFRLYNILYDSFCIVLFLIYLWPEDGSAQWPKHVVSPIIKKTKYSQLCFDLLNSFPLLHAESKVRGLRLWYDTIRYDMIWYDMIWYDTIRYDTIPYHTIRYDTIGYDKYDTIRYDTIRYDMIRYDTIWYDMIRYDTIWYDMIWYDI